MATPAPATPKPRPYRRFLTSALHTRFVHAALVSLILSWDNAALLGSRKGKNPGLEGLEAVLTMQDLLWFWFPLGPAGLKTLVFFICNLLIFLLQISTLNVGSPTSTSPFSRLRTHVFRLDTAQTFLWYLVSAWWFSEAYIWSNSGLTLVTKAESTRYDTLNERPIYLRTFYSLLAITHAIRHLYYSHSTLHIPISPVPTPQTKDIRTHPIDDKYTQLKKQMLQVVTRCATASLAVAVATPFIYTMLLRQLMWKTHLSVAKPFFNLSRSNARATGLPPIFGTMHVTILTGFLLGFTWEMCSLLFRTYLRKEPVKKDLPLSAASKDPNGTLLNGLKAKRGIVKTFAFWELAIIAQGNADRRKTIFTDIERPTGPMWAQMLDEALRVLKQVDERVSPPKTSTPTVDAKPQKIEKLPKLVPETRSEDILAPPTPSQSARKIVEGWALAGAKRIGTSPEPWRPPLDKAVKVIEESAVAEARQTITKDFKQSPIAWLFSSSNAAKINAMVLSSPYGNAALLVDAIEAVTRMMAASLQEDLYGNIIKGVPSAVKQFTTTITLIEAFIKANPPGAGNIAEVEIVLERLKAGLRELLAAFQSFLNDTALGIGELNAAKRASGQKTLEARKEKEPFQLKDAETFPREGIANQSDDAWRSLGRQRSSKDAQPRLQRGEAPARLFTRQEPQRKTSRETNGRTIRVSRRPEMEQVR